MIPPPHCEDARKLVGVGQKAALATKDSVNAAARSIVVLSIAVYAVQL